jgi:hypothetical protein
VRCGFAASRRRLRICLESFYLAKACALAFCFSSFNLEEAGGEEPEANGNHSSARVGELCLLGEDPIFFLVSDFFLAFGLDRQTNTRPGQGCGANVGGLFYVVCVVIYLVCLTLLVLCVICYWGARRVYNTPLDEFPVELSVPLIQYKTVHSIYITTKINVYTVSRIYLSQKIYLRDTEYTLLADSVILCN